MMRLAQVFWILGNPFDKGAWNKAAEYEEIDRSRKLSEFQILLCLDSLVLHS
jgi:hypothetical protein